MIETEWSKQEKEIARQAFSAAYERECISIAHKALKMMAKSMNHLTFGRFMIA